MEKQLKNIQWGEFKVGTIFKIENCKCSNVSTLSKGSIPYVGATNRNNGILRYVEGSKKLITSGKCIAFICDGEGSVGLSIYKEADFIGSTTVKVGRNDHLNKYVGAFITSIADNSARGKYNFGFKRNESHLKNEILLLPITPNGKPDYDFMEEFMREKEQKKINTFQKQIAKRLDELKSYQEVKPLNEMEWREFKIGELFVKLEQGKSKGLNHLKKTNLGVNYLGATNLHNGVLCQVEKQKSLIQKGNSIAFIRNGEGSMGYAVYKVEDFIATSDMSIGYSSNLNRYTGLFITTVADRVRGKYNFGYKRSGERLKKESILLPIDTHGQPDYKYMEHYMKKIEYQKLMAFLEMKNVSV